MTGRARDGFAIHLVFLVVAVLTLLAIAYASFTRNQARLTHRFLFAETAHQLARAGVEGTLAWLSTSPAHPALKTLRLGRPEEVEDLVLQLGPEEVGVLEKVLDVYTDTEDAEIEVRIRFEGVSSIFPKGFVSPAGARADFREKSGRMRILSHGRYFGLERTIECLKPFKIVRATPGLVGRFNLFAKNVPPGTDGVNLMEYGKRVAFPKPSGKIRLSSGNDALILFNSPKEYEPGRLESYALDEAGWVFLGDELAPGTRWLFNLTFGGGNQDPYGEQFHLIPRPVFIGADPRVTRDFSTKGQQLMSETFDRMVLKTGIYSELVPDTRPIFSRARFNQKPLKAASLHLFGTESRPSPTLVLGPAFRRYVSFSYLANKQHNKAFFLPFARTTAMSSLSPIVPLLPFNPRPSGTPPFDGRTILNDLFDNNPRLYGGFMSRVNIEPYMRSLDYMEKNLVPVPPGEGFDPAFTLEQTDRVTKLLIPGRDITRKGFLYDPRVNSRVKLIDRQGDTYFEGDLNSVTSRDLMIPERVSHVFTAKRLREWTRDGVLSVRGIMYQDPRSPEMILEDPIEIREGGTLVARGNIVIRGDITSGPTQQHPLTLVSLEGKIIIQCETVHAYLVALGEKGAVERSGSGPLEIFGGIATTALDVDKLTNGVVISSDLAKKLRWDPRIDPASTDPSHYQIVLDTSRVMTLQ